MRLWGLYLIPRDKAPDEGYLITKGSKLWAAWKLPQPLPGPARRRKAHKVSTDLQDLIHKLSTP